MPRLFSHRDRPVHLGPLPTERLPRDAGAPLHPAQQPGDAGPPRWPLAELLAEPMALCAGLLQGPVAPARAPVPDDPAARAHNLKATAHFLDATLAGICPLQASDWLPGAGALPHGHALVLLLEFSRPPHADEPGHDWIDGNQAARTDLRAAELAVVLAGYVRALGWQARGHVQGHTLVDLAALAQRAGLARAEAGVLRMPLLDSGFRLAVVTMDYPCAHDLPLAPDASLGWPDADTWLGVGGTRPGFDAAEQAQRPLHAGRWPMERIRRVALPSTRVDGAAIVRVPKRADLFTRAAAGDLGPRPQRERARFAVKHPLAAAMLPLIRGLVPLQGTRGPLAPTGWGGDAGDAARNTLAVKAMAHFLGADLVGICRLEPWMVYSHDDAGQPIVPYHRFVVVMLIEQGFETMEGASGDDWISGAQSMRAYLRGALVAGALAARLRRMGFSSRVHSNAHSELLHLPAVLMAGLGELSRIGEMILNPFLGPRSKSVLVSTDLPLQPDLPIDFGLQAMCGTCQKCARECPCAAIPFGPKVLFNGYEIWKPDVETCGRYRLTNMKGSACGRCMKTCPYNREDTVQAERLLWLSIEQPASHAALVAHDDATGGGARNPVKRWWFDLEMVDGVAVAPVAGTHARDLQPGREVKLADAKALAMYPPALQPAGDTPMSQPVPIDRRAGLAAYAAALRAPE